MVGFSFFGCGVGLGEWGVCWGFLWGFLFVCLFFDVVELE